MRLVTLLLTELSAVASVEVITLNLVVKSAVDVSMSGLVELPVPVEEKVEVVSLSMVVVLAVLVTRELVLEVLVVMSVVLSIGLWVDVSLVLMGAVELMTSLVGVMEDPVISVVI